jgi:hypothetical protein
VASSFFQAPLGLANPGRTRLRDRAGLLLTLSVQPPPRSLKPLLASLGGGQLGRELVAAAIPELFVFGGVDLGGLLQRLFGELLVVTRRALGRVGVHPGAIDGQHRDLRQTGLRAEPQDLAEERRERALVALAKPGDRRVIGLAIRADHAERDVLKTAALDHPRRALPARVGVDQQRDHHRRIVRRPALPVGAVIAIKRRQIHRLDRRDHEPREVILRQPLIQTRRQQERLLAIAPQKVPRHPRIVLNPSDGHLLYATASMESSSPARSRDDCCGQAEA